MSFKKKISVGLVGNGGREEALSWKLQKSPLCHQLYRFPQNIIYPELLDYELWALEKELDLVIIGPEAPLAAGLSDRLNSKGVLCLGPNKACAQLEASKIFAKEVMSSAEIPTARYDIFTSYDEVLSFVNGPSFFERGSVVKADDLQGGKGVIVCENSQECLQAAYLLLEDKNYPIKTKKILIEEKLSGRELSSFALMDGENVLSLGYARDYKRLNDGDKGPNTGGMGAVVHPHWPSLQIKEKIMKDVYLPLIREMKNRGIPFQGILFAGLMLTEEEDSFNVLEFNVRFGNPEAQAIIPLMEGDLLFYFLAAAKGELAKLSNHDSLKLKDLYSMHIIKASHGYPGTENISIQIGDEIFISNSFKESDHCQLFWGDMKKKSLSDKKMTNGGRVFGISVQGKCPEKLRDLAYEEMNKISFKGEVLRRDIEFS